MKRHVFSLFPLKKQEVVLWLISVSVIIFTNFILQSTDYLSLAASLVGATSLIYLAKGYAIGQILIILFALFYGWISFRNSYYGEMITYLCMTTPMAVFALIQWIKNPYKDTNEVKVRGKLSKKHYIILITTCLVVTISFYFILKGLGNASLLVSTISIATSYVAAYLTAVRSPYYAIWYALNDIVLITLWIIASVKNTENILIVANFTVFLANDLYGFISWKKMEKRQNKK